MRTFGWTPTEGELQVEIQDKKGYYHHDMQELIGEIDQDGNGCITFNEFVWLMTRYRVCHLVHNIIMEIREASKNENYRDSGKFPSAFSL